MDLCAHASALCWGVALSAWNNQWGCEFSMFGSHSADCGGAPGGETEGVPNTKGKAPNPMLTSLRWRERDTRKVLSPWSSVWCYCLSPAAFKATPSLLLPPSSPASPVCIQSPLCWDSRYSKPSLGCVCALTAALTLVFVWGAKKSWLAGRQ